MPSVYGRPITLPRRLGLKKEVGNAAPAKPLLREGPVLEPGNAEVKHT